MNVNTEIRLQKYCCTVRHKYCYDINHSLVIKQLFKVNNAIHQFN